MKTRRRIITFSLVGVLLLTGCYSVVAPTDLTHSQQTAIAGTVEAVRATSQAMASDTPTPEPTATQSSEPTATATATPVPEPVVYGPYDFPEGVNPLTGLKVADPELLKRRPVIMKISNHQIDYQPHWGLSSADMVFEYYIGWGANRFAALYYGQDESKIGPVRSIRRVDGHLGSLYQAVVGSTGGDGVDVIPYIYNYIPGRFYLDKFLCPGVCDDGRGYVYSVFGNSAALSNYFNSIGYGLENPDLTGMKFTEIAPEGGEAGSSLWVVFADLDQSRWVYDEASGKYLRYALDENTGYVLAPLLDQNTDQQLAFSNVIVLNAPHAEIKTTLHNIELIGNTGGQSATIFRDGKAYQVNWKTPDSQKPIQFFDAEGQVFPLKPGNTWVAILGTSSPVSISGGEWSFIFSIP